MTGFLTVGSSGCPGTHCLYLQSTTFGDFKTSTNDTLCVSFSTDEIFDYVLPTTVLVWDFRHVTETLFHHLLFLCDNLEFYLCV